MTHSRRKTPLRFFLLSLFLFIVALAIGIYADSRSYIDDEGLLHETIFTPMSAYVALAAAICFGLSLLTWIFGRRRGRSNDSYWN